MQRGERRLGGWFSAVTDQRDLVASETVKKSSTRLKSPTGLQELP